MEIKTFTPKEYANELKAKGKELSAKSVIRRCENNQLPTMTKAHKVGRSWIIFVGF